MNCWWLHTSAGAQVQYTLEEGSEESMRGSKHGSHGATYHWVFGQRGHVQLAIEEEETYVMAIAAQSAWRHMVTGGCSAYTMSSCSACVSSLGPPVEQSIGKEVLW